MKPTLQESALLSELVASAVGGAIALSRSNENGFSAVVEALQQTYEIAGDGAFKVVTKALDQFPNVVARLASTEHRCGERSLQCMAGRLVGDEQIEIADTEVTSAGKQNSVRVVRTRALESIEALVRFIAETGPSRLANALLVRIDCVSESWVTGDIEVKALSPQVGWFVWDRFSFTAESLAGAATSLYGIADHIQCDVRNRPAAFAPGPMFDFHPERFKDSRQYAQRARKLHGNGGLPTFEAFKAIMDLTTREMNSRLSEFTRREKLKRPVPFTLVIEAEEILALAWLKYVGAGKQIFHIPNHMADMLRATDVNQVPVAMIRVPYQSLFLHFGSQVDLELSHGWFIDGCYVEYHPEVPLISFTFTAKPSHQNRVTEWHSFGEPVEVLHLEKDVFSSDLASAVDCAVEKKLERIRTDLKKGYTDVVTELNLEAGFDLLSEGSRVRRISGTRAARQLELLDQRRHLIHSALQLTVNALCYLTAYPEDIVEHWPNDIPEHLRLNSEEGTPNERKRASQELVRLGYSRVKMCGNALSRSQYSQSNANNNGENSTVRTHWRRGHWRRHAHGEGLTLRKLIWLMPTLVNRAGTTEDIGHIYVVA